MLSAGGLVDPVARQTGLSGGAAAGLGERQVFLRGQREGERGGLLHGAGLGGRFLRGALHDEHELAAGGAVRKAIRGLGQRGADDLLMDLRELAGEGDPPVSERVEQVAQRGGELVRRFENTMVRFSPRSSSRWSRRLFLFTLRKPSNVKRPVGRPESASAVAMAVGPGTASTRMPRAAHSATRSSPGSEMAGIPASETSTQFSPASILSQITAPRPRLLCS